MLERFFHSTRCERKCALIGNPKGVCLSHGNIVSMVRGMQGVWGEKFSGHRALSFLPWAHCYGQSAEVHSLLAAGSSLGIVSIRCITKCLLGEGLTNLFFVVQQGAAS
jgi:acyl-CoA synthetase (AMP-forming)/AMP-acid ligase II